MSPDLGRNIPAGGEVFVQALHLLMESYNLMFVMGLSFY